MTLDRTLHSLPRALMNNLEMHLAHAHTSQTTRRPHPLQPSIHSIQPYLSTRGAALTTARPSKVQNSPTIFGLGFNHHHSNAAQAPVNQSSRTLQHAGSTSANKAACSNAARVQCISEQSFQRRDANAIQTPPATARMPDQD